MWVGWKWLNIHPLTIVGIEGKTTGLLKESGLNLRSGCSRMEPSKQRPSDKC